MNPKTSKLAPVFAAVSLFTIATANAAISYSLPGATITETFDSLANTGANNTWTNNSTIPGWYVAYGSGTPADYAAVSGVGANAGRLLSLGSDTAPNDRALGSQSADNGTNQHRISVILANSTTISLNQFTLTYTGELWRAITAEGADGFTFEYRIGTGAWTPVTALNFTSPYVEAGGSSTTWDGNASNRRTVVTSTVTGITWGVGEELTLRWTDNGTGGDLQAKIGIDDVNFSAIPEPSAAWLGFLGALAFTGKRRR